MSTCMDRLSQIIVLAKSKKVTDYKKAIKQLLEFWDDDSEVVLHHITEYSINSAAGDKYNSYSWNEIFNVVHELFVLEIERISRLSGNSGSLDRERIIKLVYATTERAKYFLKPKDVVISTLQVLQIQVSHIYSQYYEMYLDILKKYVLQERSQRILVAYSHWSELLKACVLLLNNVIPHVNYVQVLETIELIVKYGSCLSKLLYETKNLLPVVGKILENFETYNIKSTDILFKLTYTLCHQIVVDSRFSICRFAESMPLSLIKVKGPEEKYKLYLLFIQVHHPNGALLGNDDFYAFDNEKWKAMLSLLFKMILNDVKPVKLSKSFIDLSSEVFRQQICTNLPSLSQTSSFHNSLYIQPTKKRRIDEQDKIINLVNDRDPMRAWPMIQIATALYKKYPDCLKLNEYIEFLDVTIKLMNQACKNFPIMENLCELAVVFIQNEKRYGDEDLKSYWDKVWDAVLRYLSMSNNDIVKKGCTLVQNLISHKKVSNTNSLLKLYLTKSIQWSNFSIQTLRVFCENCVLPSDIGNCDISSTQQTSSLKLQLLQLMLSSFTKQLTTSIVIEEFSKVLIGFTFKSWYKTKNYIFENEKYSLINLDNNFYDNLKPITTDDIERCYLSLKLKTDFVFEENKISSIQISKKDDIDNPYVLEDLDLLINNLIQMMQINNTDKDLSLFIVKTSLIAQIISDLKLMNMIQCSFDEFCLVNELRICLSKIFTQINGINWSKSLRHSFEITKALITLFQTKYDVLVNDVILSLIDLSFLKKINDVLKLKQNEFETDNKLSSCKINAVIVLALYCSINSGAEISDMQLKIMSTILKVKKYSLSDKTDVISITTLLDVFAEFPNSMVSEEFIELLMTFIMELFEGWQRDDKFNCCLLKQLPKILDKIVCIDDKNQVHNVLLICKLFHGRFVKGAFGQMSHLTLVQSLNSIVQHNIFSNTEIEVLKDDVFIDFIKSPYYFVRLESLKYLYSIFCMKHINWKWKSDFFDKLKGAVHNLFLMQNQLSEDEIYEEKLLRSVSAVQILAAIICSKSTFQSPALFSLLQIAVDKGIDENIFKKIIQIINKTNSSSKSIIEENLNYLLTCWCRESNFNTFPFSLFDCQEETDFCTRYLQFIFPVLIREDKMEDVRNICGRFDVSFEQTFKNCCSRIIPWALVEEADILVQLKDNSGMFQGIGSLKSLINHNLQQIIVQSVERLHDLNHFYEIFGTTIDLPASDPPHYESNQVDQCFIRLLKIASGDEPRQSIFYIIITRKPKVLQKVLLQLTRNIYTCRITEYKAKAVHQYVYLCTKIIQELRESHCDATATYFVRDIGCTLLNLTKLNDDFIAKLACKYLYQMLKDILPRRSEQVGNILDVCVKTLVSLVSDPNVNSPAKDVLIFLLRENKTNLFEAIKNLGSLPSFVELRDDLDLESEFLRVNVQHFLNTNDDKNCNISSLQNLKRQLSTKKSQLEKMYEELESLQGFAEHCASSLLHRLIYRLIRLSESVDSKTALEAAKCLGVLGPADLSTMILHPQESQRRETLDKADTLTRKVCEMLTELIISSDIEVRSASSEVLYVILETPWGARLIADMEFENANRSDKLFKDFLYPFKSSNKSTTSSNIASFKIQVSEFERMFDPENLLWSESSSDCYNTWLASITSGVANCLNGFYSASLTPLFHLNVPFCEEILPRLISLLIDAYPNLTTKICQCVNRLFNYHFNIDVIENTVLNVPQVRMNKSQNAIRCMLDVVNHLRIQSNEQVHLDFDYLPIAMAAQFSSAYFSSVLYAELWCRSNLKIMRDFDSIPMIDQIYEQDQNLGKIVQDILKEAYIKIGDPDSIYGCGSSHLQNRKSRIQYYTNFQKLDKVLLSHDVELSNGKPSCTGMISSLKESNLYYLAKNISSATPMEVDSIDYLHYDILWRLGDWNQITNVRSSQYSEKVFDYSVYHYEALKSLHENDRSTLEKCLEYAHLCIIKELSSISLESCKAVYPKLSQLQMLREIEEFSNTNPDDFEILLANWEKQKYIFNNNFQYIEPILAQRSIMFQTQKSFSNYPIINNAFINTQLNTAQLAQDQGHLTVAARALETLLKQTNIDEDAENRLLYHEARLAWIRKDEDLARFNLRSIINKDSVKPSLLAHSLRIYGNWIAENKSENPQAIINKYYDKAIATYLSMAQLSQDDLRDGCKARAALAQFAHEQYLMITEYLKSPQFESLKECIDYSRNVAAKNIKSSDQDIARASKISTRQTSNDYLEMEVIQKDRIMYLALAMRNYLGTLQDSDEHDLLIFRLVSLWLDNMYDEELNALFECHLVQVPSYKFIPLVPQLAPHMSNIPDTFSQKISLVLERCAKDHPHHTLPVLLALKNLYNDSKYCEKKVITQEPRVLGAQQLIQKLMTTNVRPIIQEMDKLSDALVQLAYFNLDKDKKKAMIANGPIPKRLGLHEVKNFQYSMVLTLPLDVKKDGNYSDIISVRKYEEIYSNVGGINAPKKIICIGTDGIQRSQLVKGKDDLRQDAVMQQVFTIMNSLLKTNKDAKHRKLHVRTYKVIPLTQRSGVLQWCENTLPLSSILTGDGSSQLGLHRKYYPNDYAPNDCRKRLQGAKNLPLRQNVFLDCCKNLRPAFHHFFTENYLSPETWFERRLAYTRSVATTSIIGYILGLGDRHVSNILIDKSTAEVIHIDFGIAFEQGKVLPTPETVPFRLTRDIEVAMGVSGIEGTMRRCCEETTSVLRKQREIIVTLLRVLLYDPLYSWAITPAKAATYQSEHSSRASESKDSNSPVNIETNKLAERALLRVQQKLQGIEEGVASSISGQVERLIQQARDPSNLSRLFEGWQAYL